MKKILFFALATILLFSFISCTVKVTVSVDKGKLQVTNEATSSTTITGVYLASITSPGTWGSNLISGSSIAKGSSVELKDINIGIYYIKLDLSTGSTTTSAIKFVGTLTSDLLTEVKLQGDWSVDKPKLKVTNSLKDAAVYKVYISTSAIGPWTTVFGGDGLYILPSSSSADISIDTAGTYYIKVDLSEDGSVSAISTSSSVFSNGSTTTVTVSDTSFNIPKGTIRVINGLTNGTIDGVYVVPSSYSTWGSNLLSSGQTIAPSASLSSIQVTPGTYKVKVTTGGTSYWLKNVALSPVVASQNLDVTLNQTDWTFYN